jgi:hypothetical protein
MSFRRTFVALSVALALFAGAAAAAAAQKASSRVPKVHAPPTSARLADTASLNKARSTTASKPPPPVRPAEVPSDETSRFAESDAGTKTPGSTSIDRRWWDLLDLVGVHFWAGEAGDAQPSPDAAAPSPEFRSRFEPLPATPVVRTKIEQDAGTSVAQHPPPVGMATGVRAASFVERISSAIEGVGAHLFDVVTTAARMVTASEAPRVHSMNETMIVARVPASTVGDGSAAIVISHINIEDGKLTMNVARSQAKNGVTIDFGLNFPSSVAAVMEVGKPRVERLPNKMANMYIPIKKMKLGHISARPGIIDDVVYAGDVRLLPPEGHLEEDRYEVRPQCGCFHRHPEWPTPLLHL